MTAPSPLTPSRANLATWSIRTPVPSILLFALLSMAGVFGFNALGIQRFPDLDLPTITIAASLEGAAPQQLETEVARKIEDQLVSLDRLDHIATTITDGAVNMTVSFDIEKDTQVALDEVRSAVDDARADLPQEMNPPTVARVTKESMPILTYAVRSSHMDEQDLSWFIDNDFSRAVLAVKGVAETTRSGGIDREVHIDLDPAKMAGLGVTPAAVSTALKAVQDDNSGGLGEVGGMRQSLRTLGAVGSVSEIAALSIPLEGGRRLRLDQVARVSDTFADRSSAAFLDGQPAIIAQVTRAKGFSDVSVARDVETAVAAFAAAHPEVEITLAHTTVEPILENYRGSLHLLLEGAVLTVLVVWWFLRDARATLLSAVALPLSILPAFAVMAMAGFSLNTISLLALALVVGVLVDDAIVEIENIARHMERGRTPRESAMEAATEIGLAVVATTLTLVAVFLPTAFMGGIPGKVFFQFGVTASVAILASLLVARLLTPMLAATFMRPSPQPHADGWLMQRYMVLARACLTHPRRTLAAALAFFVASLALIPAVPTGFFPARDDGQSQVSITLAPGSTLDDTLALTRQAQSLILAMPEIEHVIAKVGTATSGGNMSPISTSADPRSATLLVQLVPRDQRDRPQSEVEATMRRALKALPGARIQVGRGGDGEKLPITLTSDDPVALDQAAAAVEADLRTLPGIGAVTSGAALQRPEIQIRPDVARAAALGVTATDLATAVRMATYGDYSSSLPKLNLPQRQIAIRVRLDPKVRTDLDALGQIRVTGAQGTVALASVADIGFGSGPSQIDRLDRARNVTLSVELNGRALGDVMREARALPSLASLPPSVHLVEQGELQRMGELFSSFGMAIGVGIFCIYAVLVLLFHDFLQPFTILAALPLAVGGAILALLLTGEMFSMPSVIGLLMLMGIVTKNSILLVEYAIMARRERGLARLDALMDACHKRARPIVMTTLAMGAGMMPIALGLGADPSFRQPMAIVVIGGVVTSTFLSLLVVPVIFLFVDNLHNGLRRLFGHGAGTVTTQN
ncbi:efflux RND transporter permease subunit [Pararhodospirillum oryzae]|uniref:ACR family transporter n=1 Tax=Pararhodospirillum oryzae TaxID=478448 RepID=A0A512HB04_9PROT|nr:efflux RND transporter permease subunit [Pararhodospirillum oryzae]GEO82636.1 ACR family transporter [Pararhodospirillum oryzae]